MRKKITVVLSVLLVLLLFASCSKAGGPASGSGAVAAGETGSQPEKQQQEQKYWWEKYTSYDTAEFDPDKWDKNFYLNGESIGAYPWVVRDLPAIGLYVDNPDYDEPIIDWEGRASRYENASLYPLPPGVHSIEDLPAEWDYGMMRDEYTWSFGDSFRVSNAQYPEPAPFGDMQIGQLYIDVADISEEDNLILSPYKDWGVEDFEDMTLDDIVEVFGVPFYIDDMSFSSDRPKDKAVFALYYHYQYDGYCISVTAYANDNAETYYVDNIGLFDAIIYPEYENEETFLEGHYGFDSVEEFIDDVASMVPEV